MPMRHFAIAVLIALGVGLACPQPLLAQAPNPSSAASQIKVCSLVSKEEVKKHLPWADLLDSMPIEEEPVGNFGSSCNYPSVFIQVLPFSQGFMDACQKQDRTEAVSDVGEEAYFRNNSDRYAELCVKSDRHVLTLQANVNSTVEAVKPNVLNLARVLVTKLP